MAHLIDSHINANTIRVPYIAFNALSDLTNVKWSNNRVVSSRTGTGPDAGIAIVGSGLQRNTFLRNNFADVENRSRFSLSTPGNNVFTQNDFGQTILAPNFSLAPGAVIDGGGNLCQAPLGPYPLTCQ